MLVIASALGPIDARTRYAPERCELALYGAS